MQIYQKMDIGTAKPCGEKDVSFAGNIFGKTQTIALMVYSNMQIPGKELQVTRLVVFSIAISLLAIIASEYLQKKKKYLVR